MPPYTVEMILLYIAFTVFSSNAQIGSATDALGGAGVGGSHAIDSVWTNPAAVGEISGMFGGVQYFQAPVAANTDLKQYSLTLTDGISGALPGGVGYRYRTYDVAGTQINEHVFRFSAGLRVMDNFLVGASGYRVRTDPAVGHNVNQDNGDIGLFWRPIPRLTLGGVTRAVFGSKKDVFLPSKVSPSGGVGAEFALLDMMSIRGELNYAYEGNPDRRWQHQLGLEFRHLYFVTTRFGVNSDDFRGETRLSAGAAWDGPMLKVGYSYQKEVRQELGESHTVDIWLGF